MGLLHQIVGHTLPNNQHTALWFMVGAVLLCATVSPAPAEYFSNMQETKTAETQQLSSQSLAAIGQSMLAFANLEIGNGAEAKVQLQRAVAIMNEAAKGYQALSEKNATISLEVKFPDALTELAQTMEVSADKIATVGDVLGLTSQALSTTAGVLEEFINDPTPDRYTAVRKSIENLLRTGDLGSKLLQ
jgi:hypothetical protein